LDFLARIDGFVVESDVEDGVHHTGHGVSCAGAAGDEEGQSSGVAEFFAHRFFDVSHCLLDLCFEFGGVLSAVCVEVGADFGGDGESCGYGQSDFCHFGEVCPFSAEEITHGCVAVGCFCSEVVNVFSHKIKVCKDL